jgi:hypothetical protein
MPQRNLAGKPRQQIQANGANDRKSDHIGDIEHVLVGQEGKNNQKNKEKAQPEFDEQGLKNLFVLDISFLEIPAPHKIKPAQ